MSASALEAFAISHAQRQSQSALQALAGALAMVTALPGGDHAPSRDAVAASIQRAIARGMIDDGAANNLLQAAELVLALAIPSSRGRLAHRWIVVEQTDGWGIASAVVGHRDCEETAEWEDDDYVHRGWHIPRCEICGERTEHNWEEADESVGVDGHSLTPTLTWTDTRGHSETIDCCEECAGDVVRAAGGGK